MESDLISRSDISDILRGHSIDTEEDVQHVAELVHKRISRIDAVPVVHERWIDKCRGKVCVCSRCDQEFDHTYDAIKDEWLFCPKCGARMDAEENE